MLPDSFSKGCKENKSNGIRRNLDKAGIVGTGNSWTVPSYPYIPKFLHACLPEDFFCGVMLGPSSFLPMEKQPSLLNSEHQPFLKTGAPFCSNIQKHSHLILSADFTKL